MGKTETMNPAPPVACSLSERGLTERGAELRRGLFAAAEERRELADGYAYRFLGTEETLTALLDFVGAERRCCTFFLIELAFESGHGPIWLTLQGPEGTKAFVGDAFGGVEEGGRHKAVVRRLVDEVLNAGRMEVVDELFAPTLAPEAKRWIAPFRASFPDMRMETVDLVADADTVVGWFACSGTHLGEWLGHPPTGRRFEAVTEAYRFRFAEGQIVEAHGVEDTLGRLEQLGLR